MINVGNLICLEEKYNEEAEDLPYEEKVEVYHKSKYSQVQEFIKKYVKWTEEDIDKRSKELAKLYYTKIMGEDNIAFYYFKYF